MIPKDPMILLSYVNTSFGIITILWKHCVPAAD